jgi:nitrogen regulatory protein PII
MYQMILLVLDNIDQCNSVLDAWEATGVGGVTIFESTGLGRMRKSGIRDDIPLMPSLAKLMQTREERHRTLFTVVEGDEMVDRIVGITETLLGDLNQPHNGVLFILPVSRVVGLKGGQSRASKGKTDTG